LDAAESLIKKSDPPLLICVTGV